MATALLEDQLWKLIKPLLPERKRRNRYPGRKRIDDRKILSGILFVLTTGSPGSNCRRSLATAQG